MEPTLPMAPNRWRADAEVLESLAEDIGGQLSALVGDEVLGRAEPLGGFQKQVGDIGCGRFAGENTSAQWESGEDVEDDGELEGEQAEERRDVGEIRHGDVVGIAGPEGAGGWSAEGRHGNRGRPFFSNPSDGLCGELPTGAGKCLSDALVSFEARSRHSLNHMADDVGKSANGWSGSYERAYGSPLRVLHALLPPASDGVGGDVEALRSFFLSPDQ